MGKPFNIQDAFLIYNNVVYQVGEYHNHLNYVYHNYSIFGISQDEYDYLQKTVDKSSFQYELLNLAIRKGAIQVRNISALKMTFINLKDHSMIDKLVEGIIDNASLFLYTMQVTFLDERDSDGIAKNIMELYEL